MDISCSPLPVLELSYRRRCFIIPYEIYAGGVGEPTGRIHPNKSSCTGVCTRSVGNYAIAVGRHIVWGENSRRTVCRYLGAIVDTLLRHGLDDCRKEQKGRNDNSFHKCGIYRCNVRCTVADKDSIFSLITPTWNTPFDCISHETRRYLNRMILLLYSFYSLRGVDIVSVVWKQRGSPKMSLFRAANVID